MSYEIPPSANALGGISRAARNTASHDNFSSDVSASNGNVRVGVFKTKAFSPPPSSRGAVSSTENPSVVVPSTISPNGNGS